MTWQTALVRSGIAEAAEPAPGPQWTTCVNSFHARRDHRTKLRFHTCGMGTGMNRPLDSFVLLRATKSLQTLWGLFSYLDVLDCKST